MSFGLGLGLGSDGAMPPVCGRLTFWHFHSSYLVPIPSTRSGLSKGQFGPGRSGGPDASACTRPEPRAVSRAASAPNRLTVPGKTAGFVRRIHGQCDGPGNRGVELNGALSNHHLRLALSRLGAIHEGLVTTAPAAPLTPRSSPRKPVPVLQTVTRVLEIADQPMRACEVHTAAEQFLGEPFSPDVGESEPGEVCREPGFAGPARPARLLPLGGPR